MHGTHTYLLLTRERSLPTPQMCAKACAARAGAQHTTRKHSRPRTHARVRGSKSPRSTVERAEAGKSAQESMRQTSTRGAVRHSCPRQGDNLAHKVHQDRDPSRWRRCRRLAAARTMMDSMSAPASTAPMNTRAISSASPPSCRTPKQRRHGGQQYEHVSSQRPDPAFKRPFLPHSPPSLSLDFGQGRTTRCKLRKYIQHITYKCRVHTWAYHAARGSDQAHAVTRCNDFPS